MDIDIGIDIIYISYISYIRYIVYISIYIFRSILLNHHK